MHHHKYCHGFQNNPYVYSAIQEKQQTFIFFSYYADEGRILLNVVKNESILILTEFY